MPTINITVKNKIAVSPEEEIVCGNGTYKIAFVFDDEWENSGTKTARFVYNGTHVDVILEGNECTAPEIINATVCAIGVFAGDKHTSTPALVTCRKSIRCGGTVPATHSPDAYIQVLELYEQLIAEVEELNEKVEQGGGTPYTLPVATPDTLGGVKPEGKSKDMTQSVGVDADGRLWTEPAKEEESLEAVLYTPQTLTQEQQSQARQNIGIDELPTGGGNTYRLIAKVVFGDGYRMQYINIEQDMDGKPLELTKLLICADWKAHPTGRQDCGLYLNDEIDMPYIFDIEKTAYKHVLQAEAFDGFCRIETNTKIEGTSKAGGGSVYVRDMTGSKINKIRWASPSGYFIPPDGSTFIVYGY